MASSTNSVFKERLLTAFKDNTTLITECQSIASEIQSGQIKLYTFVEELGPFVTDKDVSARERGVTALSSVLENLSKDFLNEAELHFITTFYCDRLKDHHSIIPTVLKGILAIVQMQHLPHDSLPSLFRVLFENVQCQTQLLSDRRNIYLIFTTVWQHRIEDLKVMGPDFVVGVINSIDGERDPRNLMLLFEALPHFIKEFSLGHLTEEMFEYIACYFPVDFNPSGSDALNITRDDLAEKLAPCLYAVPEFAEFCVPLIIDKLFSSLRVAKLDSLNLLCKSAQTFGAKGFKEHLSELWSALRKDIMSGDDVELRNASLKAVMSLVAVLSDDAGLCETFIDKLITDTMSSLCDVQLSLFRPAEKLLESVAMVNKQSCVQILRMIIPLCLGQYSTKTSLTDKVILVETLNSFLKISADLGFSIKSVPELSWTDIPQVYLNELTLQHVELKSKIIQGLTIQKAYLNDVHRSLLYNAICTEIETGCDQIRTTCHACILSFAILYPREILNLIKDKFHLTGDEETKEIKIRRIEAMSAVAKARELGIEVLPQIVLQANANDSEVSLTALTCLHRLVATKNIDFDVQHYLYNECNIIDKLTSIRISAVDHRLDLISSICRLIVKSLTVDEQQEIVNRYATVLSEKVSSTDAVFIMSILIPLRQNVELKICQTLLENLYNLILSGETRHVRETTCKFISVVLNKMDDDNECFQQTLSFFEKMIAGSLGSDDDIQIKKAVVTLHIWLTKALITKGSCHALAFLNNLVNTLKHNDVGQYVALEYKILTNKHEDALVEENFCNVRIFYKQRVFEHLIQHNDEFKDSPRQYYLTALVTLLEEVPMELLFMHLTKLVPLLVESLSLDNEQLIFSALVTLKLLLNTKHVIFSDKAQCFIPRFIKLSTYKSMRVRIAALECLTNYCNYPTVLINTYKQDVLGQLAVTLDDPKRLVRKAAVRARTMWFLVGAPGGIKDQ